MSDASLIFSERACDTGFADGLLYNEYLNNKIIFSFEVKENSLEADILRYTSNEVVSFQELCLKIENKKNISFRSNFEVKKIIEYYKERGLIYSNKDYSEIVSTILLK